MAVRMMESSPMPFSVKPAWSRVLMRLSWFIAIFLRMGRLV